MTRNSVIGAIVSVLVLVAAVVLASVIDPENIGGRLALYGLAVVAFVVAIVLLVRALVRRARGAAPR